jgi:threonine/homoserine/homoserine lactone efflux protein
MTLTLLVFLFPLAFSPGPGNLLFAANAAQFGARATIPASLGYHLATWLVTAALGLGFSTTLAQSPAAFMALRWGGALFVLYLAWRLAGTGAGGTMQARPAGFADGILLLLLNPKAYVIVALMFSQFLGPGSGPAQIIGITTIFTLNNLLAFTVWTLLGDRLAARFRDEAAARRLNACLGLGLAAVALWLIGG